MIRRGRNNNLYGFISIPVLSIGIVLVTMVLAGAYVYKNLSSKLAEEETPKKIQSEVTPNPKAYSPQEAGGPLSPTVFPERAPEFTQATKTPASTPKSASVIKAPTSTPTNTPSPKAPTISEIKIYDQNGYGVTISWKTDEPTTEQIEYGIPTNYGKETAPKPADFATEHIVKLKNLIANETYHYRIKVVNNKGTQVVTEDATFKTGLLSCSGGADELPKPTISPNGGTFGGPVNVTITSPTNTGISYTLDGTDPFTNFKARFTSNNTLTFTLSQSATVKAQTAGLSSPTTYCKNPDDATAVFVINN